MPVEVVEVNIKHLQPLESSKAINATVEVHRAHKGCIPVRLQVQASMKAWISISCEGFVASVASKQEHGSCCSSLASGCRVPYGTHVYSET